MFFDREKSVVRVVEEAYDMRRLDSTQVFYLRGSEAIWVPSEIKECVNLELKVAQTMRDYEYDLLMKILAIVEEDAKDRWSFKLPPREPVSRAKARQARQQARTARAHRRR